MPTMHLFATHPTRSLLLIAAVALQAFSLSDVTRAVAAQIVYSNNFSSPPGGEWSIGTTSTTPNKPLEYGGFLGQFSGNDSVVLSLTSLPGPGLYQISFDLFVIRSWDGVETFLSDPPDTWSVGLDGQTPWLLTSFSNTLNPQTYPDPFSPAAFNAAAAPPAARYSGLTHAARSGAFEVNTLGFLYPGVGVNDSVYRLAPFEFQIGGNSAAIRFSGQGLSGLADESWGIDNVVVTRVAEPSSLILIAACGMGWLVRGATRRRA